MFTWHDHLWQILWLKHENSKFLTIEKLTHDKIQIEQMAPCGLPRLA
jgi:hypothetical protein